MTYKKKNKEYHTGGTVPKSNKIIVKGGENRLCLRLHLLDLKDQQGQ
jgi:hypothetical protein